MTPSWSDVARSGRAVVCCVSDRSRLAGRAEPDFAGLVTRLALAARAGVDLLQVREPDLSSRDLFDLVRRILDATGQSAARVIVNDRLDVALAAGAHGVHLKSESIDTGAARSIAPEGFLVGRSVHAAAEAEQAARDGADYVIVGTVFPTMSKPGKGAAGLDLLRDAVGRCSVPVLAIGGMTVERAGEAAAAGAGGLAAIGLFMEADGTTEQVRLGLDTTVAAIRRAFAPHGGEDPAWP